MRDRLLRYRFPLLIGLLLLAYALRMFRLDHQSLWWDEGISLHLATSALIELLQDRLNNIHPPLYFIILKGWLALVGVHSFTGRYLSALASLGQVAVVTVDGSREGVRAILAGKLHSTSAQFPKQIGQVAAEKAYEHIAGRPVDKDIKVPVKLITRENATEFLNSL